jgi:hypothetical protein
MKRQIAAYAALLATLGAASQAQAHDWGADRPRWGDAPYYGQRAGRERDRDEYYRYRPAWRQPWHGQWREGWRADYRPPAWRPWNEERAWTEYRRYPPPRYVYMDYDDAYRDCDDGDIALVISLPLRY